MKLFTILVLFMVHSLFCVAQNSCLNSKDTLLNITFGSGVNPGPVLSEVEPTASTSFGYTSVSGSPAQPAPIDGFYSITNNVPFNDGFWHGGSLDHTPGDVNGYMVFYNSSLDPGEFYQQTVSGLCESECYVFSAWVANAINPLSISGVLPNITFEIRQTNGTVIAIKNTGDIQETSSFDWKRFSVDFSIPIGVSTVVIKLKNNNPGGLTTVGNDLAIDDIVLRKCLPSDNLANSIDSQSDIKTKNKIDITPNPAQDYITISGISGSDEYKVVNQLGAVVKSGHGQSLYIADLNPGFYSLVCGKKTSTFIKR